MRYIKLFTSFSGRIPRKWYWLGFVTMVVVFGLGRYVIKTLRGDEIPGPDGLPVMLWSLLGMIAFGAVIVKRFQDRDWPRWVGWLAAAAIAFNIPAGYFGLPGDPAKFTLIDQALFWPFLLIWLFAFIDNGFLRGTRGPNRYGPEPGERA